jgi:KUP system potassium uptake protein
MSASAKSKGQVAALTLAAVGIVYGDIGTSPLYALKEVFATNHGVVLNHANLLGAVSLFLWGLMIIVSLKYVTLILRADNHGEGGIMALTALALNAVDQRARLKHILLLIGIFGAALFFGDGVITPAISVLSAIEGIELATPVLKTYVVPMTVLVLVGLYAVQSKGSSSIGKWFGPIMLVWFLALAVMGVVNIVLQPMILEAINPIHAWRFFTNNHWTGFIALGAIVLAFTGAEALYADMGHFGRQPIRLAWSLIVFPALALNYLGQGAVLLTNTGALDNLFFKQLGSWSIYPLVVLSTVATVIASQATISGTFSMVRESIALGFLPRMEIKHTSEREMGQIYIPLINWVQLIAVVLAVIGFGSSTNLATAYGIAVTGTMLTTTILTFFVIRYGWKYNLALCWFATGFFLLIDAAFFSSNAIKIGSGGWFPLLIGGFMFVVLLTWRTGRALVFANLQKDAIPLEAFLESLFVSPPLRVPGTAVFIRGEGDGVPHALLHNLLHNKVLHERVLFLTVRNLSIPRAEGERLRVHALGHACYQIDLFYGFQENRDIPAALAELDTNGRPFQMMETSFFISRQNVLPRTGGGMALWREHLFATMARNARDAADYYQIPANRVIELGTQVEI